MTEAIKTVIFDIDNTLYDFTYSNNIALNKLREYTKENFSWTYEEFDAKHVKVQEDIYSLMGHNGICRDRILRYKWMLEESSLPLHHAARMYELYWNTMLDTLRPYDGARDVMKAVKDMGLSVGIGTDMTVYIQVLKLERMNMMQYVDFMITSEEAGEEKPSPAFFDMCIKKAKCSPGECLFVGDSLSKDYVGAVSAGMKALLFVPNGSDDNIPEDVRNIHSLRQVLEYI